MVVRKVDFRSADRRVAELGESSILSENVVLSENSPELTIH